MNSTQPSPKRQRMDSHYDSTAANLPKSNYFGGTFNANSPSPGMMQTKTNEQKMRVIKSNKRDSVVSIEKIPAPLIDQSNQIGLMSKTMRDYFPAAKSMRTGTAGQAKRHLYATGNKLTSNNNHVFMTTRGAHSNEASVNRISSVKINNDPIPQKLTNDSQEFSIR